MSELPNPAPSESTTPTGHERESRALEELEPIPTEVNLSKIKEVASAHRLLKRNLEKPCMSDISQAVRMLTKLDEEVETEGASKATLLAQQEIIDRVEDLYGENAFGTYERMRREEALLGRQRALLEDK